MRVAGLISGTSMDGIDAAAVEIEASGVRLLEYSSTPYAASLREALERSDGVAEGNCAAQISSLNFEVGEAFAQAALRLVQRVPGVVLIGSHGQTIFHEPKPDASSGRVPSTLQIGQPEVIAQRTGVTTIADFRVADVAAGGEGAPLVPFVDFKLLASRHECRVALNVGGIANITILPADAASSEVRAFDTGPGNMLIDRAVRALYPQEGGFDRGGRIAASGSVSAELLTWLLSDPYFRMPPPKTTGRERFGDRFFEQVLKRARDVGCSDADVVATLTHLTARTVADCIPPECAVLVVSGGGAHNRTLLRALERSLRERGIGAQTLPSTQFGLDVDAKEAIAFALLAYETLYGRQNTLPAVTGARTAVVMGKIVPGANFAALMRSVWG
jgi:anhydro-N-acetylmuramic acid kinase